MTEMMICSRYFLSGTCILFLCILSTMIVLRCCCSLHTDYYRRGWFCCSFVLLDITFTFDRVWYIPFCWWWPTRYISFIVVFVLMEGAVTMHSVLLYCSLWHSVADSVFCGWEADDPSTGCFCSWYSILMKSIPRAVIQCSHSIHSEGWSGLVSLSGLRNSIVCLSQAGKCLRAVTQWLMLCVPDSMMWLLCMSIIPTVLWLFDSGSLIPWYFSEMTVWHYIVLNLLFRFSITTITTFDTFISCSVRIWYLGQVFILLHCSFFIDTIPPNFTYCDVPSGLVVILLTERSCSSVVDVVHLLLRYGGIGLEWYSVSLPFAFPFHGRYVSGIDDATVGLEWKCTRTCFTLHFFLYGIRAGTLRHLMDCSAFQGIHSLLHSLCVLLQITFWLWSKYPLFCDWPIVVDWW